MTDQHIIQTIAHTIHVSEKQIQTALSLLQSGNTIPFIARYRKGSDGYAERNTAAPNPGAVRI